MMNYEGKEFKSINSSDFKFDESQEKEEEIKKIKEDNKSLTDKIKDLLKDKVSEVEINNNIGNGASSLLAKGPISLEMEKVLSEMPGAEMNKAEKILALNPEHALFEKLKNSENSENFEKLVDILYNQALILEGFPIDNPVQFIKNLNNLIK